MSPHSSLVSRLSDWIPISEFETAMRNYFLGPRSAAEIADYRAKRGPMKKLRDEVTPVLHHVKFIKAEGEIRFEPGDGVPDCWLRNDSSADPQGIEVTVAQSREQHYLGQELNEKGMGRGFLGLPDDAPSQEFTVRLAKPRVMYSTTSALQLFESGVKRCLRKKAKAKYTGFDLLIEAPSYGLQNERWSGIHEDLRSAAREMPFRQIHVIVVRGSEPFGFRIK